MDQKELFHAETIHELHWKGMPDFKMEDLTSHRKIIVHFRDDDDFSKFAKVIGQKIGPKQPSVWYPEMPHRKASNMAYINE